MDELLKTIAESTGMPESLVKRSAEARAAAEGKSLDEVLAQWAGEQAPAAAPPPAPAPEVADVAPEPASEPEPEAPPAVGEPEEPPVDEGDDSSIVEVLEPTAGIPDDDGQDAAEDEDESEFALVSGMNRYPLWLTATFVIIPLIAVLYILVLPTGPDCGSSGQLLLDPVTGEAVGCDGAPYGVDVVNNFSAGQALYLTNCTACHGASGGGGAGPALAGGAVVETFPEGTCVDHSLWVALGSAGWSDEVGDV